MRGSTAGSVDFVPLPLNAWLHCTASLAWPALLALLGLTAPGRCPAAGADDAALMQAAVLLATVDRLDAGCAGRYSPAQRAQVQGWQADNRIDAWRPRLDALRATPDRAGQVDRAVEQVLRRVRGQGAGDCQAAASLTRLPDARLGNLRRGAADAAAVPEATAATAGGASLAGARIDSFAFATRPKMGIGGAVTLDIHPVVLFSGGELLTDVRGLRFPGGLAAHRSAHPQAWSRWRRAGGEVQLLKGGRWVKLPFDKTHARLPAGLRLSGRFRSLGGTGDVAVGGTQSVTVVDEYRFCPDGHVVRSGTVGSSVETGDTSVVTRGGPGQRAGRYHVDGLLLHIDYDDGSREQRVLITDPDRPGSALWLDGQGYVQRR